MGSETCLHCGCCRLWQPVTRAICEGDQARAMKEKLLLEESQLQQVRQCHSLAPWTPKFFRLDPTTQEWRYQYEK